MMSHLWSNVSCCGVVMKRPYRAFISSTTDDLQMERRLVTQAVAACGCEPVCQESWPLTGTPPEKQIEEHLSQCDIYVLLLAGCYGKISPSGKGFTELEYVWREAAIFRASPDQTSRNREEV